MVLLWVLSWPFSYSKAEIVTTENLLVDSTDTNINDVATTGTDYGLTGSEFTTGNESIGGGSKTFIIDLSEYENVDSINYGSIVYSHSSNELVPICSATESDCKDEFVITVKLYSNNTLVETYKHSYYDIDWSGLKTFDYSQDVSSLMFNSAELELYGMDAGYTSGYYGPGFSDYYFTATYEIIEIIINEVLTSIEMNFIDSNMDIYEDLTIDIQFEDIQGDIVSFEFDMNTPEVIDIQIDAPTMEEFTVETTMEEIPMDMEIVELDMEQMVEEIDVEVSQEQSDSEPTQESDMETEEEEQQETVQQKPTKEEVAQKIMARVVEQSNQQVLNNIKLAVMAQLTDVEGFSAYQSKTLEDAELYVSEIMYKDIQLDDPYAKPYSLAQDYIMEQIINSQYGRN